MRLYSGRQVILFSVGSVSFILLCILVLNAVSILPGGSSSDQHTAGARVETIQGMSPGGNPRTAADALPVDTQPSFTQDELNNIRVYEERNRGVVNLTTETVAYNWFLEPVPQSGGSGSGSIIDARGYVLTNNHVVANAAKVFVTLVGGTQLPGEVIGADSENDLAVVKFSPPHGVELVTVPLGRSADLRVGQKVFAIGNPFGLDRTLTSGIVSGLGRPLQTQNNLVIRGMIQTDAAINPGNSGGPLLDSAGNMIGINTMIYSPSGGSIGIGFAVPVDTARRVVPDLIQYGVVKRGWIDIVPRQLFPPLVRYARLSVDNGVLVSQIDRGGNAERAGIKGGSASRAVRYGNTTIYLGGDIIIEANGRSVKSLANLYEALENTKPGEVVPVAVMRGRGRMEFNVRLSERPERFQWR